MPAKDLLTITHVSPSQEWLESRNEPIIEPDQSIIDPHHHFSEHWGGYFLKELVRDLKSGHKLCGTVYVQCGLAYRESGPDYLKPVGETEAVMSIVESIPAEYQELNIAAGIIGHADLSMGESVDEILEAHIRVAGDRFKGIRDSGAWNSDFRHGVLPRPQRGLFLDRQFQLGFSRLHKQGLSFESWVYHHQLDELLALARAFPETPIMINHIGAPLGVGPYKDKRAEVMEQWKPMMKALSACHNVYVKLGGLGTAVFGYHFNELPVAPSSEVLAEAWGPYFNTCIDLFGADRCMFESNFPVDRSISSYHVLWNAFKRVVSSASSSEKDALFHNNAARFYKLPVPLIKSAV
ncbi:amidohydrolase family protein [Alcaligenaceae bacterium CGII-47]|nr:amidohydrolase family protein [Alcaligenaceae bacterium CGII-47]